MGNSKHLFTMTLLAVLPAAAQNLQAPSALTAVSATRSEVRLSWTGNDSKATGYTIERKPLNGAYGAVGSSAAATYSDRAIDPFATYVYRVRATQAPDGISAPSNEITVGPPPVGLSVAAPLDGGMTRNQLEDESNFGRRLQIALDGNGDPALAYRVSSPGGDGERSVLEFVCWNRAQYRWNAPVTVASAGDVESTRPLSLAHDATTNAWAVAYHEMGAVNSIRIATSRDDGATWTVARAFECGEYSCQNPAVALAQGRIWIAFSRDYDGIRLVSGNLADGPAKWTSETLPLPPGGQSQRSELALALDASQLPAVAFWANSDSYNVILGLWRARTGTVTMMDTNGYQSDYTFVDLAFAGTAARLVAEARRSEDYYSVYDKVLWFVREEGGSLVGPRSLPSDGNQYLSYAALAVGSRGQAAIAAAETGGNSDGVRCGQLKLLQSGDLNAWSACSPIARSEEPFYSVSSPRPVFAGNDKLYVGFTSPSSSGQMAGVLLWREP